MRMGSFFHFNLNDFHFCENTCAHSEEKKTCASKQSNLQSLSVNIFCTIMSPHMRDLKLSNMTKKIKKKRRRSINLAVFFKTLNACIIERVSGMISKAIHSYTTCWCSVCTQTINDKKQIFRVCFFGKVQQKNKQNPDSILHLHWVHTHIQWCVSEAYDNTRSEQHHHAVALLLNQAYNQHSSNGKKRGKHTEVYKVCNYCCFGRITLTQTQAHTRKNFTYLVPTCVCLIWEHAAMSGKVTHMHIKCYKTCVMLFKAPADTRGEKGYFPNFLSSVSLNHSSLPTDKSPTPSPPLFLCFENPWWRLKKLHLLTSQIRAWNHEMPVEFRTHFVSIFF